MPINTYYTYVWAGVNPADGRPMYYDRNNNITYSPVAADRRIVGDSNPRVLGGFDNTLSYKGFSLDVLFQYSYGAKSYLQTAQYIETSGSVPSNQNVNQLERWTTPGQVTWVPRGYSNLTEPGGYNIQNLSSRFIENGAYIRLKQVTLDYALPKPLLARLKIPSLSVYFQGYNLATITHYRGDDPENSNNNLNFYPNPRTLTFGVRGRF
ncbi:MAG: hypothetical protein EOP45_03200 [Sphingobacteriaceae bacterium]|nr:MAG: hypothetical protein EOP45_03200 [Sphingobacteriaceae bacterium]